MMFATIKILVVYKIIISFINSTVLASLIYFLKESSYLKHSLPTETMSRRNVTFREIFYINFETLQLSEPLLMLYLLNVISKNFHHGIFNLFYLTVMKY